jgi:hypothetical protein
MTLNQIYQSEIKDLFREGYEAPPRLKILRKPNVDSNNNNLVEVENTT